jgi:HEPN domain-containing protein
MALSPQEWLRQADYDVDTAQAMFDAGRYFYAVFMCHLSIEKALKGVFMARLRDVPPKIHNLMSLLKRIGAIPPESIGKFVVRLNEASVVTRYPDTLEAVQRDFTAQTVPQVLAATRETLAWIKTLF